MAIELVSEIVSRTTEVCSLFKMLQLPNGNQTQKMISADRRKRLRDVHGFIVNHFRTLNAIHTRILQDQNKERPEIEEEGYDLRSLIPYKDSPVSPPDDTPQIVELEKQKLELLRINEEKNKQMLEIMRHLRLLVQDINIDAPLRLER